MSPAPRPVPPLPGSQRQLPWLGLLLLLAAFVALIAVIGPFHELPVQDDWDYARTVRLFLERGVFERSEIAQAAEVFTTVWGALFSRVAGFSFVTLRFSTLTLSLAALLAVYALLGEFGLSAPRRLLGAATLMVCPLFLFLSNSFMTDVPTLFWEVAALLLYCRAFRQGSLQLAVVASACAALAALTRQVALLVGLAAAAYALSHARAGRVRWALASGLLPIASLSAYLLWLRATGGETWANGQITVAATLSLYLHGQIIGLIVRRAVIALMTLGLYALPVWLSALPVLGAARAARRQWRPRAVIVAVLGALVVAAGVVRLARDGLWMPYLTDVLTRQGLRPYLAYYAYEAGAFRPDLLPLPVWVCLTLLAAGLGWLLFVVSARWLVVRPSAPAGEHAGGQRQRLDPAASGLAPRPLLAWVGLALAAASLGFSEFYERFLLLLFPIVILLVLDSTKQVKWAPIPAFTGLLVMALASVWLMRDYWGWMDLRWSVGSSLLEQGVPADLIDGGYEWNAWHLYDPAIEQIRRTGAPMSIAPWLVVLDPEYLLAFTPLEGYHVEQALRFPTPFGADHGRFYVLRRDPPPDGSLRIDSELQRFSAFIKAPA